MPTWEPVNSDPLDLRNPTPEFRAPGDETPVIEPLPVTEESPIIELGLSQIAKNRQAFMDRLVSEDAELRTLATALRLRGYTVQLIAEGLQVPVARVRRVLRQSRQDGNLNDILADLTHDALPRAVEQLIAAIDKGDEWAIKETLKGLGAFRRYSNAEGTHAKDDGKLQVNFILPTVPQVMNPRGIVGTPRGEIVDATVQEVGQQEAAAVGPLESGSGSPGRD